MFRLHRRAVAFTRIGDKGGKVPDVRSEHRPPNPFYPSCALRARQEPTEPAWFRCCAVPRHA
jgi:hypothetical protein